MAARILSIADVDGDSDPDLLAVDGSESQLVWQVNDGTGQFRTQIPVSVDINAQRSWVADFDGDGTQDILAKTTNRAWSYLPNYLPMLPQLTF